MAETRSAAPKVTYATLAAGQTPEFNKAYDEAAERVKGALGKTHGLLIGGRGTGLCRRAESALPTASKPAKLLFF